MGLNNNGKENGNYYVSFRVQGFGLGSENLVSRVVMGISRVTIWITGFINLLAKSP